LYRTLVSFTSFKMRIKRQRRKLRGKYSGNCLSCAAKWSKCWYIASIENQSEWETRLSKIVTPATDEVCFQCWDAKIRTSPKRKMHFKEEPPLNDTVSLEYTNTSTTPYLRPSKRVDRNKRRVLNEDYSYDFSTTPSPQSSQTTNDNKLKDDGFEELDDFIDDNDDEIDSGVSDEGIILDEETAVLLLSTAFRTNNLNIFKIDASFSEDDDEITDFSKESEEDKSKKRGAYYCGKCGKLKKGHVCPDPSDQSPVTVPPLQSDLPFEPTFQLVQSLMPSMLAQPVVS